MSLKDYTDPRFAEALEMQWENIDVCIDAKVDRKNPDLSQYFHLEFSEKLYISSVEFLAPPLLFRCAKQRDGGGRIWLTKYKF